MARNASGTHSLPAGNPVVAGTTITPTWANDTLNDLSTEVTDSLSRSGKGPMLAPIESVDGAVGAPGVTFDSEPTSGLYRAGAGDVRVAILGADRAQVTATGLAVTGTVDISGGLADDASHGNRGGGALHADAVAGGASGFLTGTDKSKLDAATASATAGTLALRDGAGKLFGFGLDAGGQLITNAGSVSSTATPGTDWTASVNTVSKSLHMVAFVLTLGAGAGSDWASVATLPSGYRPGVGFYFPGMIVDASTGKQYGAMFALSTGGVLGVYAYDDGAEMKSPPLAIGVNDLVYASGVFFAA